jgi:gliding motility-associated-like protein
MYLIFCYKENLHLFNKYKALLIIFFVSASISNSKAQYATAPTTSSTGGLSNPLGGTGTAYSDLRYQYILYASDLSGAGLSANYVLTSISYFINSLNSKSYVGMTISLKATNATNLTSWDASGSTQVFTGTPSIWNPGWYEMSFSSNFIWNGTSNLLVSVCWDNAATSLGSDITFLNTGSLGRAIFNQATTGIGCSLTTTTQSQNVPRTRFGYSSPPPNPPSTATASSTSICSSQSSTLSVTGSVGATYWFAGSCGNSITNSIGSGVSLVVSPTTTTTYYARNYLNGLWSSNCASTTIYVNTPSVPNNPTSNSPQCSSVTITRSGTPPSGTTWYWQGTNANGTSTSLGSGTTFNATSTGTYYLRAQNSSGCWSSTSGSISVSITSTTQAPNNPTSNSPQCTSVTITRSGTPPSGTTWYWQGNNANGTSTNLGSGSTYTALSSGTYYIRALNSSGCWSSTSGSISVSITSTTSAPNNPTSNSPQCTSVIITRSGTPPSGTTWYWQGTNANGTSTSLGSGATYTATTSGTYYLRAQNSAGCWSNSSASIAVSISNTPQAPNNPTSNSPQCDFVTITRSGTPPSGTTWYWQGQMADGTSTALGSDSTYTVVSSGTYYIRAQNSTGCWSDSSTSIVVIQECEIKIPIAISPNGDLLNDTWDIIGIDQIEDFKIEIFDLSGNLVYALFESETNGVYTPFVGKNNNDVDIIDGDYIYSIKSKNKDLKYAGILTIKRN